MDNRPIGVFDSGVGGLTAVKELRRILPNENLVFFGDTGRVPYGTKSRAVVQRYAAQDIAFLKQHDVKMVVAACGTVSSTITDDMVGSVGVPFTGVVTPAAQSACAASATGRIGVIGTPTTIRSMSYGKAIRAIRPNAVIIGKACPLFVPLVENGLVDKDNPITRLTAEMYLKSFLEEDVDTVILGCTHFPVIRDVIADVLEHKPVLIDAGQVTAQYVKKFLTQHDLLTSSDSEGSERFFVSDSTEDFCRTASIFLGHDIKGSIEGVDIEKYTV